MRKLALLTFLISMLACSDNQAQEQAVEEAKEMAEKAVEKKVDEAKPIVKRTFDKTEEAEAKAAEAKAAVAEVVAKADKEMMDYQAGIHYEVLSPAWDTEADDAVIVYEFFGYLCPHCNTFQPYMQSFEAKKADNVKLVRVPVIFQPMWKMYAQSYYTAESMGLLEDTPQRIFNAIHTRLRQFSTNEQIWAW